MNSIHDMGGMQDMGPIEPDDRYVAFEEPWEGRVYAMRQLLGQKLKWNGFTFRYNRQIMTAEEYLRMSYYEQWLFGIVGLLVKDGVVTREEVESGKPAPGSAKYTPPANRAGEASAPMAPRFQVGQTVRARNINPTTHTQLPRYARGRLGTINRDHGVFAFADTAAARLGDHPQHVYSVRFSARELWGEQAAPKDAVYLDLWDSHLDPA